MDLKKIGLKHIAWKLANGDYSTLHQDFAASLKNIYFLPDLKWKVNVTVVFPAPSPITVVKKGKTSKNSIAVSWQEPDRPNGIILEYEIKYFEKVTADDGHVMHI